jgi:hypothetical protein
MARARAALPPDNTASELEPAELREAAFAAAGLGLAKSVAKAMSSRPSVL